MAKVTYKVNTAVVDKIKCEADKYTEGITDECRDEAKMLAPKDTGRLADSIVTTKLEDGKYNYGSDLEYARFVEFGTRFQQPQPYLRPALELVKSNHTS